MQTSRPPKKKEIRNELDKYNKDWQNKLFRIIFNNVLKYFYTVQYEQNTISSMDSAKIEEDFYSELNKENASFKTKVKEKIWNIGKDRKKTKMQQDLFLTTLNKILKDENNCCEKTDFDNIKTLAETLPLAVKRSIIHVLELVSWFWTINWNKKPIDNEIWQDFFIYLDFLFVSNNTNDITSISSDTKKSLITNVFKFFPETLDENKPSSYYKNVYEEMKNIFKRDFDFTEKDYVYLDYYLEEKFPKFFEKTKENKQSTFLSDRRELFKGATKSQQEHNPSQSPRKLVEDALQAPTNLTLFRAK